MCRQGGPRGGLLISVMVNGQNVRALIPREVSERVCACESVALQLDERMECVLTQNKNMQKKAHTYLLF